MFDEVHPFILEGPVAELVQEEQQLMISSALQTLKQWVDEHRGWIIIGVALPAGTSTISWIG
jgi:hypothetical protein